MGKKANLAGGIVFAVVAVLHLMRFFLPVPIVIGTFSIPVWASAVIFLGAGTLSAYLIRAWKAQE